MPRRKETKGEKNKMKKAAIVILGICLAAFTLLFARNFTTTAQVQENNSTNRQDLEIKKSQSEAGQTSAQTSEGIPIMPAVDFKAKIVNMKEIAAESPDTKGEDEELDEADTYLTDPLANKRPIPPDAISPKTEEDKTAALKGFMSNPLVPSPTTSVSFQAVPDNNTTVPPDTHGAVGPNHVMTVLNSQIRIQNKTGSILFTTTLNAFWASVASNGVFDPKILYDPYSNRWLFTACAGIQSTTSGILIGVSQTNDPTGSWLLYNARADANGINWADYPSFGFNKDWVVVSVNMFGIASGSFVETRTFVFRKSAIFNNMLGGVFFARPHSDGFTIAPAITYSNTEPTLYCLSTWNGNSGGNGFLRLYTLTGAVGAEAFTATNTFPNSGGRTWEFASPLNLAPQLGTGTGIMTNDSRMQNAVFRNGSLWAAHSVATPVVTNNRSGVQWWQINPSTGGVLQIGRIEDTSNVNFYAFPSIAVNQNNDVLIGYATFSSSIFGSAGYAFRASSDTAGTLRDPAVLKSGAGCYIKVFDSKNRWGDYSNTVVDPSDDTNFWTIQEYADPASPVGQCFNGSGRWATWWGKVSPSVVCSYSLTSPSQNFTSAGGNGSTGVTTQNGCGWTTSVAAPRPESGENKNVNIDYSVSAPTATFPGTGSGAIPDGLAGTPPQFGAPLNINFAVSGITAPISSVSANVTLTHTWAGDVDMVLKAPGGTPSQVLVSRIGVTTAGSFGSASDYSGLYNFIDSAAGTNIWTAAAATPIPAGDYRTTTPGQPGQTNPAPVTNLTSVFTGLTTSQINGTWALTVRDAASADTGTVTAANLNITGTGGGNWINITSGSSGTSSGQINYTVSANPSTSPRSGTITVNGTEVHTVNQAGMSSPVAKSPFDFDGDLKTDVSIYRPSNGQWWINRSSNGTTFAATFGNSADRIAPADYTGDNKTDIAIWRPSTGEWFILRSENGTYYSFGFGTNGDIPAPGDFDLDGKADAVVFRPSNGVWYVNNSSGAPVSTILFGQNGDVPVTADYDGDGRADAAVFRPSTGTWWLRRSTLGVIAFQFGNSTDKPAPGDYTGDGKADVAFFRQPTGEWYILRSENQSYYSGVFGVLNDIPVPGDYDGDGKHDPAVFRPSNNTWYVQRSTNINNPLIQTFGIAGDKPVPSAFVP
jgi:subtilisin-like proprotein convertase family protein